MYDTLTVTATYAGLINAVFIPFALYICWSKNGRFSFKQQPLSIVGRSETARLFGIFVIIAAILEGVFILRVFSSFPELKTPLLATLPFIGIAAFILTGTVSSKVSFILHRTGVILMMLSLIAWSFMFHYAFLSISFPVGIFGLLLSAFLCIGVPYLYYRYGQFGVSTLLFSAGVAIWNILITTTL